MSAPGRRMDSPKGAGMDACAALCVPSGFVRSIVLRVAHMVDTHSCRPGFRPSHIVLFTGRSAQSLLATELLSASPLCGPHAAVSVRETICFSGGLADAIALPSPQTFPTYFRKFPRRRDSRDLRTGSFADAAVKVLQCHVLVNRLHGGLDQNPS